MITATDLEFAEVQVPPVIAVQMRSECAFDPATIGETMRQAFGEVMAFVTRHGLRLNGQPRAIYTSYDPKSVSFIVALPISAPPSAPVDESQSLWILFRDWKRTNSAIADRIRN